MVCEGFALAKLHIQVFPRLASEDCEVHGPQPIPWSPQQPIFDRHRAQSLQIQVKFAKF